MKSAEDILNTLRNFSRVNLPDAIVYLYGSRAEGNAKSSSDWDLLVIINQQTVSLTTEKKLLDKFYELELQTGEIFSPLVYSIGEWERRKDITPLFKTVSKDGIRLQ